MLIRIGFVFVLFAAVAGHFAVAQESAADNAAPGVYKKIENFSAQRKITNALCGFFIKPVIVCNAPAAEIPGSQPGDTYSGFEGKVIRSIHITTLDPFGYSISDTSAKPHDFLSKSGNALHVKTQNITIRNRLLIKKYDRFDSLLVKESERLVRSQSYIHDVSVQTLPAGINSDSVDIFIRVSDLWSIVPDGALSANSFTLELAEKNMAGLGHSFSNRYSQNYLNGRNSFAAYYYIPNIKNTYISTRLRYAVDEERNFLKSLEIERPFFSPVARWAGGLNLSLQMRPIWVYKNDTTRLYLNSKFNIQDYWLATAWQIFKGNSESNRSTKLILSGRLYNIRYLEKPPEQPELNDYFASERFYLAGLGISSRKYVKQSYIFRFGTTEDVPVGQAYGIVGGYQLKNQERWYWGLRHSWGTIFRWGYFGTHFEYGTFINATTHSQGMIITRINYFSPLFSIGSWKFRQFARPEFTFGINRNTYDRLTINDGYGLNGFNSIMLTGTSRLLFVIQTQSYAPWNLAGFRFGPYLNFAFGMLGNEASGFRYSRVYPQFGIGVLIQNDYLVFNNLQISFAYYPTIPGTGENVFKANPLRTTDFGLPDFIIGKPDILTFR